MATRKKIQIGYSDFLRLCMVDDRDDFLCGLKVRKDGVWVEPPSNSICLTRQELAVLSEHPEKDLTKPALAFPCSLQQLYDFLKFYAAEDCIDQYELAKIKKRESDFIEKQSTQDNDLQDPVDKIEQKAINQEKAVTKTDIPTIAFYKDGDYWKIGKKGAEKTLKHLKGFGYIAFLIRHKDEFFKPLEVLHFGEVPDESKYLNRMDFQKIGSSSELTKNIKYLKEKLTTETNFAEREEIADKISGLSKIKNEGFKAFKQKSDSCRTNVYKLIQNAAEAIQNALPRSSPLNKYFRYGKSEVIKTGKEFSYQQFNFKLSVNWVLEKPS